ncbi:SDR family oxidoreductase [Phycicoccus sp. CSK15P-2]|uniref:SDR family oxidoreductase n=1 Tax=Phycicoccus sp. CSK15P-2 TaxID=2807627 RepID=UPI001950C3EA|nr:SDR family oxidoreductase [Phycicoccus sp. CSK15P-2]MBM6405608.1 SDR family oxidoreductase [Phycicoccus sp. CSK15P-2]
MSTTTAPPLSWSPVSCAALVTGCGSTSGLSSGTGRHLAILLQEQGWEVYATGRDPEVMGDLAARGIHTRRLDLTDPQSMKEVVTEIQDHHGSVGLLVNNAAYSLNGTVLETSIDAARDQFETNLFGTFELTRMVLPDMIAARSGRIVMMSSIFGLFGTAGRGYYEASKHALEGLSDALRLEVRNLGLDVVVVEPSPIRGGFVPDDVSALGLSGREEVYGPFWEHFVRWHETYRETERPTGRGRTAVTSEAVARCVVRAAGARQPRIRYRIGLPVRLLGTMRGLIGETNWDRFVRWFFPHPQAASTIRAQEVLR